MRTRATLIGADWPRKILHVDLDAFYPSVEVLDNPDLAGQPVIVGGLGRRGVVASASYEAREHGVHSAMPMERARRLCPDAVYLRPRFSRYRELSKQVFAIYEAWTDRVEPLSLDEAYLDVSHHISSPIDIAKSIRNSIRRKTGLTASAGVSANKFLAKLASDLDKPDGLTVIRLEEARAFLAPMPVEKLWGVGPASAERLREHGFERIGQLAESGAEELEEILGSRAGGFGSSPTAATIAASNRRGSLSRSLRRPPTRLTCRPGPRYGRASRSSPLTWSDGWCAGA